MCAPAECGQLGDHGAGPWCGFFCWGTRGESQAAGHTLAVCIPPKFLCWNPSPQSGGTWRRVRPGEVAGRGPESGALMVALVPS